MDNKTVLLMRHAKSSWKDSQLDDFDRPLNGRGRKAAATIGDRLRSESFTIDQIVSSPSVRTRQTLDRMFADWKQVPPTSFDDELYHASPDQMISLLSQLPSTVNCAMLVGHNPGLEDLLSRITTTPMHYPTAALAQIEFDIQDWSELTDQAVGRLIQLWRPRELE